MIDPRPADGTALTGEVPTRLRSSIFLLGPLLSRFRQAEAVYPGGCAIGKRPIDLHLNGLKALGAQIRESDGSVSVDGSAMLAATTRLAFPSVGATENLMMAMVRLPGRSRIINAAREPEIEDLAGFLNAMGARITGAGSREITVDGVAHLQGIVYEPIPDRIVGGTLLCAGAVTGGSITLKGARAAHMRAVIAALRSMGAKIEEYHSGVSLQMNGPLRSVSISTAPFPGFPTDMQAPLMALACCAEGCSRITETMFENRFQHVEPLRRMGARIALDSRTAHIDGTALHGAQMEAKDLRCGAALVLAALAAEGESEVSGVPLIDRGYDALEVMLQGLGADISRERKD